MPKEKKLQPPQHQRRQPGREHKIIPRPRSRDWLARFPLARPSARPPMSRFPKPLHSSNHSTVAQGRLSLGMTGC